MDEYSFEGPLVMNWRRQVNRAISVTSNAGPHRRSLSQRPLFSFKDILGPRSRRNIKFRWVILAFMICSPPLWHHIQLFRPRCAGVWNELGTTVRPFCSKLTVEVGERILASLAREAPISRMVRTPQGLMLGHDKSSLAFVSSLDGLD